MFKHRNYLRAPIGFKLNMQQKDKERNDIRLPIVVKTRQDLTALFSLCPTPFNHAMFSFFHITPTASV